MIRLAALALLGVTLAGCATSGVRIQSQVLSDQLAKAPEHFIIAAVNNEPVAFMAHAGSTPRGYDIVSAYGPTDHARQVMRELEADYALREVSAWPIESLHMHCAVLEIPAGADRDALLSKLSQDHRVALTQPVQTFAMRTDAKAGGDAYNDPYFGLQRGFLEMDVTDAHPWSHGDGVKIALIDTGVDTNHPDLRGSIDAASNFVDADDQQFRRDRHGTEMAGVIAAVANNGEGIVGIAPGARLLIYKACWQERAGIDAAHCNSFTLAKALSAAFDAHAQIINMSLAGPDDPLVDDLIRVGLHRGVLIVGAAAQEGGLLHQPGVIEVASAEAPMASGTALLAPGQEILTLLPGGHYDFASGASIATAQVSGVVALMLSKSPSLSSTGAYQLLRDTSLPAGTDASSKRVNACAALVTLVHQGLCRGGEEGSGGTLAAH